MRTMRTTKSPDKKCRQKLKQRIQDVNPEGALEYFQTSVNVLEARKLAWVSPHSTSSYVVVMLGKEKHRTSIRKNNEPCFREYFLFEWYATVREVQHTNLWLAVMEPKCCAPPRLLGETTIDLGSVWAQPNHQVFHKWAQLSLPREPEAGAVGFLKVDISIVCRGDVQAMPMIVSPENNEGTISHNPGLASSEQQTANYLITVYAAFALPFGLQSQGDRRYGKPPSTYVKVSFCGLTGKTAVQYRNNNPGYCEQISIVETFPNKCQLIRLEVCSADAAFNKVLASADLRLGLISHHGEKGFVPTFGPSLLHMYGNASGIGTSGETGPYYKGALLVSLKTVVPCYLQGLRSTNVEPVPPVQMNNLWMWENFTIFCSILEVSMLDKRIFGKHCGVALNVCEFPCTYQTDRDFILMLNEIKSRKLYYTGSLDVNVTSSDYGHLDFLNEFPVLQLAACLPDFRFRLILNNMVRVIATELKCALTSIEKKFTSSDYTILSDLVDELSVAAENTATSIRVFLEVEPCIDPRPDSHGDFKCNETELDQKQLTLQKEELIKIYHQLTKKGRRNSSMNLMGIVSKTSRDSFSVNKKEMKLMLAEVHDLVQKISSLVFSSPEGWPDIVIWLLNGTSRVAYYKLPLADIAFADMPGQCGRYCGQIQTIYLKPLKCSKHLNTLPTSCSCIAGKMELLAWMAPFKQSDMFYRCLPKGYKLKSKELYMYVKTSSIMLQCRVFINCAKLIMNSEISNLPCSFVRVNALNSVIETKVQQNTSTPVWNVMLKIHSLTFISHSRLMESPRIIIVEMYDNDDLTGKTEFLGRAEVQPVFDDRPDYQYAPKLQWYPIFRGAEKTGQILMSAQYLLVPETLMKSTLYNVDETCNEGGNKEIVMEELAIEKLPHCLMPKSSTYKVDVYWWGLRGVSITRKPCAIMEIDDLVIKSDIITEGKPNCNFPSGRTSQIFEAPLNEVYCPPLMIRLCDSSTFGRTLFMGTNVVKNPIKYIVDWLPKNAREASLKSVSIMSSNFVRVSNTIFIKKNTTPSEDNTENSKITVSSSFLQTRKSQPAWKRLFFTKEPAEEEIVLLPIFSKGKDSFNLPKKNPVPETHDWWLRFFDSLKGRISDDGMGKIKIYQSELEAQPEFSKFKDWCKTLKLYCGKKSGIAEKDEKLQCGVMKVGIAIYKWPPPADTVPVNSSGVELGQGFFDDYPVNEPLKFLVRVYVIRALNLVPRSFTGQSEPYVVINCGSKHSEDNHSYSTNTVNPVFGKMYEFQCSLPEDYLLTVSIYDNEALCPDDLIGKTNIDLEDRIYSRHRARVGLSSDYKAMGAAKWRDCVKPSAILEELCLKNHLPAPIFLDTSTVIVNDVQYKDTDERSKTYVSALERKENICLELLHKWQTLPLCGYQLVPEHVETRKLLNPDKLGDDQGKIQMWVDIFPLDTGKNIPLPVDIAPRKVEDYELRVIVWSVQGIRSAYQAENKGKDIYVKAWMTSAEQAQYTDIHYQSMYGEGNFNWRLIFHFQYQHAEKTMILKEKGPFTEVEDHFPPVLIIQVIDSDAVSNDDCLGMLTLDLNSIPKGTTLAKDCKLSSLDTIKRINLFSARNIRGWWSLKNIDLNTGTAKFSGVIDMELNLISKEMAVIMPAGLGRDPPIPLPDPIRPDSYQGVARPFLETFFSGGGTEYFVIGIILVLTFAVAFYFEFPNILLGTLLR